MPPGWQGPLPTWCPDGAPAPTRRLAPLQLLQRVAARLGVMGCLVTAGVYLPARMWRTLEPRARRGPPAAVGPAACGLPDARQQPPRGSEQGEPPAADGPQPRLALGTRGGAATPKVAKRMGAGSTLVPVSFGCRSRMPHLCYAAPIRVGPAQDASECRAPRACEEFGYASTSAPLNERHSWR